MSPQSWHPSNSISSSIKDFINGKESFVDVEKKSIEISTPKASKIDEKKSVDLNNISVISNNEIINKSKK